MNILKVIYNSCLRFIATIYRFIKSVIIGREKVPSGLPKIEEPETRYQTKITLAMLANTQGIGYYSLRAIYPILKMNPRTQTISQIIEQLPSDVRNKELIAKTLHNPNRSILESVVKRYDSHKRNGVQFYIEEEVGFPSKLRVIQNPPYWLFVQGSISILNSNRIVAIVGTRKPSSHSLRITQSLVELLVDNDFVILSGLAQGIDQVAHKTTIKCGGKTIAVLGHGVNVTLSKSSSILRDKIIDTGGAVITEYFPNVQYSRNTFVLRNRIQSALSNTVIPIECKKRSGTAHTIRYAIEQHIRMFSITYNNTREKHNDVYDIMRFNAMPVFNLPADGNKMILYIQSANRQKQRKSDKQLPLNM